ncbi:MAG: FAD binding domain-containing protein [Acidimicrobiales bacterium]
MIPSPFDYVRPGSLDEALELLAEHGDEAKLLAGGHSLLPLMKLRMAAPAVLVDIGRLDQLGGARLDGEDLCIGALTTHHELATNPLVRSETPVLAHVASQIGDPQVRHRGTIGGSIAHGDAASDLPAVVLALSGRLELASSGGKRQVDSGEFYRGFLETAIEPDELLTEIRVRRAPGGFGFEKLVKRAQDWAIVAAVAVQVDGGVGVGLVNMASVPVRARGVEESVVAGAPLELAAEQADSSLDPPSDMNASADFRRHLARVLTRRALEKAFA